MSGVQQKSSAPARFLRQKGRSCNSSAPRYHPVSTRAQMPGGSQNAVTGRGRSALLRFSHRPLRSELQPARTRKPFQPVKLLSLPCGTDLLSPSLRLGVFRFITICILPHFAEVCKGCASSFCKCRTQQHFSGRFILHLSTAHKSHYLPARVQKSPTAAFLLPRWSAHPCNRPRS